MALTDSERETIVSLSDFNDIATVYTSQRKIITKLKRNPAFVTEEEGTFEGTGWLRGHMPAKLIGFRAPSTLTTEQRQQRANTMKATRDRQLGQGPYAKRKK